jgi:type IV fimbrial biogenesis protein FimT
MKTNRPHGFTLTELLTTVTIASILVVIALPSFSNLMKNERLTTQINTLFSHLQYARSEAITRHYQVVVCASRDGATCSGTWTDGWIVFSDQDASGTVNDDDVLLRAHGKLKGDNTLTSTGGLIIIFDDRGFSPDASSTLTVSDSRGSEYAKSISISNTGRIRSGA